MANYRTFHSQLTSIMETLTRAAVAEICELVDDGYAVLHLEISRHQKENEELRQKLQLIESIIARGAGGGPEKIGAPARDSRVRDGILREARAKASMVEESVSRDLGENQPISVQIKQEEPEQHGTGGGDGCDVLSQGSVSEDVEEMTLDTHTRSEESDAHTHTHTHTHRLPDSLDSHTLSEAEPVEARAHTHTHTHTPAEAHSSLEPSAAILLESDEENTHGDSALDSHTHSDSDTHTHSDAFSDTHTPSEVLSDGHTDTHTHALSFLDRVCVKRETGGVCELVADWHSRTAAATAQHTHTLAQPLTHTHTHTRALHHTHPALYATGMSLLPPAHTHTHTHTHAHTHPLVRSGLGGKRSFICGYCGKSFTTAQSLDTHTRIHTGERPFRCAQCGKRFTQSGHLTAHQTVHTGERPHPCSFCSKRFAGKQYLRIHMKKHHPDSHTHT